MMATGSRRHSSRIGTVSILLSLATHALAGLVIVRTGALERWIHPHSNAPVPVLVTETSDHLLAGVHDGLEQAPPIIEPAATTPPEMIAASPSFDGAPEPMPTHLSGPSDSVALPQVGNRSARAVDLSWQKVQSPQPQANAHPTELAATGITRGPVPKGDNRPASYPASELRLKHEGTVVLRLQIECDGIVSDVAIHTSSGFPGLDQAALRDARQWSFDPALENGQPVASERIQPVVYRLKRAPIASN